MALRAELPVSSGIFYNGTIQAAAKALDQPLPAEHATTFTKYPLASKLQVSEAIESSLKAKKDWEQTPFVDRAAIFLKAAELVATKYRYELIAATMLGQGKNMWQAEIDAAAELADFFRLNCNYAAELLGRQPTRGTDGMWRWVLLQMRDACKLTLWIVEWITDLLRASCMLCRPLTSQRLVVI
jgi:1-pyrroline-5-carboxylate dehydrogenase